MNNRLLKLALLFSIALSGNAFAKVHEITQNDNVVNTLNGASQGDTIRFFPGTYEVNILLGEKNLQLEGVDTKNTILKSKNGTEPTIIVDGSNNSSVRNFTFLASEIGILVSSSTSNLSISNNVFRLGVNSTALEIENSASGEIANNTFYGNSLNIRALSNSTSIINNIFANYTDLFEFGTTLPEIISFNCIEKNDANFSLATSNQVDARADFVSTNIDSNDFHLEVDSDCIDLEGITSDYDAAGAYGGENFDKTPDSVEITSINKSDLTAIVVQWIASEDHQVDGYKLYYHTEAIYSDAQDSYLTLDSRNSNLSVVDAGTELSHTINDFNSQAEQTATPVLNSVVPGKNKLTLTWSAVANATSYIVHYRGGNDTPQELDVGNVNSHVITGLNNNTAYTVWLQAKNQMSYYFQVAAYVEKSDDDDTDELTESYFVIEDEKLDIGDQVLSEISNQILMQPEAIVAYPILPNEGCFIATAAFGFYSVEEVQVLRAFRDNYLLTNETGQTFVKWYYHHGPRAASVINAYPLLKPVVRVLLYPLILTAKLLK